MPRNTFEQRVQDHLGLNFEYEAVSLPYVIHHKYIPDFVDREAKRIIEAKGFFPASDRQKMKAVKLANPDWTIEIWFQKDPHTQMISKTSKTSYAEWCRKNGIIAKQGPLPVKTKTKLARQRGA